MRIVELRDQIQAMNKEVVDKDDVMLALNGLPHYWKPFIQGLSGRGILPSFDSLRDDCIQEESHLNVRGF